MRPVLRRSYTRALLFFASLAAFADCGAPLKAEEPRRAGEDWWSIQPLREVSPPAVSLSEWSQRPVDRFVYHRMAEKGLRPAPEADRVTFIRRATFDLLGLPPKPEEIHAFQNDPHPGAHERLVDRLLASPHYGERWGRHWLDTVRFGESHGYEGNRLRENAWQYRDYVIESFNTDKPYDRFVLEQLAGDQLAGGEVSEDNRDLFIATAFIVSGPYDTVTNGSVEFTRQIRANSLNDFIATTGSAFLGLTFNCARCHDHKFDPILQKDYYRLSAIFDGVQHRGKTLESPEELRSREELLARLEAELTSLREELTALEFSAEPRIDQRREKILASDRKPLSDAALRDRLIETVLSDEENRRRAELQSRISDVAAQIAAVPKAKVFYVSSFIQPGEPTYFLKGGNVMDRGEPILPASPSTLARALPGFELASDSTEGERRLALARWITDKRNPLTARVIANRVWHYHFGRGIVPTPSNLGFSGAKPTHPQLLDYLARRLQQLGWRLKAFHKEILLSRTYRQSSRFDEANARIDADAALLWRFPPRRLEAEAIRDSILEVSGKLDRQMGGPGFRLYRYSVDNVAIYYPMETFGEETYRRAVYHTNPRSVKVELLGQYDCPDNSLPVPRRDSTISPLQALNLLNNSFTMDQARFFGERLVREVGSNAGMQLRRAYSLAFGRSPEPEEERVGLEIIEKHGLYVFCRALLNANEFIYVM
jgi:hypothetical protein